MACMTWSDLVGERDAARAAVEAANAAWSETAADSAEETAAQAVCDAAEARAAAAEAALEAYDGPRPWILRDDGVEETIDACDLDEARERAEEWAREGGWDLTGGTIWVDVAIIDPATRERVERVTVQIDQPEPRCERGHEHDWQSPHEIVGGLKENPGVWGHGGGVIITEVCMHCGCARITDTWAQRPDTGEQGLTSVSYEPGRYADEIAELAAEAEESA